MSLAIADLLALTLAAYRADEVAPLIPQVADLVDASGGGTGEDDGVGVGCSAFVPEPTGVGAQPYGPQRIEVMTGRGRHSVHAMRDTIQQSVCSEAGESEPSVRA